MSPGDSLREEPVPQGRLKITQDAILGTLPSKWTIRDSGHSTQDHVLGNFQPSLRDCSLAHPNPGLNVLGYSQPSLRDSIWRG